MFCKFCNKECKNQNSLRNHERMCPHNPERKLMDYKERSRKYFAGPPRKGRNQYTVDGSQYVISDETRKLMSENNKQITWTSDRRRQHSEKMREVAKTNPEAYSSSNRGRTKCYEVDGVKLQGKWEVTFYRWCKDNHIVVERPSVGFPYMFDGNRTYFPDFYLPEKHLYVEIKGYETEKDRAKWSYFPHELLVLRAKEIKNIRQGTFVL